MRFFILLAAVAVASAVQIERANFGAYKAKFNKSYSPVEEPIRLAAYMKTLNEINEHNKEYNEGKHTFTMGLNKHSDWTQEELDARNGFLGGESYPGSDAPIRTPLTTMADAIDWREKGAVQEVKDQGACGSCWAFGAVGGLEGAWAINKGELPNCSEQELVSCDNSQSQGCSGGWPELCFDYVKGKGENGIETQASYPYTSGGGSDGTCDKAKISDGKDVAALCTGKEAVAKDEASLQEACSNQGPISIAIYANSKFQSYNGGVFDDQGCCDHQLNHAVLLVGFDSTASPPYWIIKNSWGTSWGEDGYIRFVMGKKMCGLEQYAYYPLV